MPVDNSSLTPQQRLAISRRALFNQIDSAADHDREPAPRAQASVGAATHARAPIGGKRGAIGSIPWLGVARSFGERWWRRHPANALVQLAHPMLQRYARKQPGKLVAIAAGTGAVFMLVKPWRLLSVTALVAAVLKTSDVADMVTTLMHSNAVSWNDPEE